MKIGIVGCGAVGRRHASHLSKLPGVEVVACCDTDASAARALAAEFDASPTDDLGDLLALPLNGLTVCTPPRAHVDAVVRACETGVRVLCEKPLAPTVEECRRIPPDSEVMCAFKFRHLSGAARLRDVIGRGELGVIVAVRGTAVSNADMTGRWFSDPEVAGGGVLLDNGVHLLDLCRFLFGPVTAVCAAKSGGTRRLAVEESASLQVRMEAGPIAQILLSWEAPAPMPPLIEVYGTAGYARLGYELEVFDASGRQRTLHVPAEGVDVWREVLATFIKYVNGSGTPSATLEDGFAAVAAAEAAYRSIDSGRWERPALFGGREAWRNAGEMSTAP